MDSAETVAEDARAAALARYAILDTPPEPEFDLVTQLAARACATPIATITLIDRKRQWFKSRVGLAVRETLRDVAFCAHTARSAAPFEVSDASRDPLFAENPLVVGSPFLRFYAGVPLLAPDGACIGALAVMDRTPRRLSDEQRAILVHLAKMVMEELERRATSARRAAVIGPGADLRLPLVLQQTPAIVWTVDRRLRFTSSLGSGLARLGFADDHALGTPLAAFVGDSPQAPQVIEAHEQALAGEGAGLPVAFGGRHYQMRVEPLRDPAGETIGAIGVALDVTERQVMEAQLARAERLAAIGTMAASVAHEINNPLAYLAANLECLDEWFGGVAGREAPRPDGFEQAQTSLAEARLGLGRVREIMGDLKLFSRMDEAREPVELRRVLERAIAMTKNEITARARLFVDLQPVPTVHGAESRLGQVFVNLLLNAAQAIPTGAPSDHEVRIRTSVDEAGRSVVSVEDTGVGIEPHLQERIFDPFFTTKAVGEGSGLGLFVCERIVSALDGELRVESTPGSGARFSVALPAVCAVERPAMPAPTAARRTRLLIVDDEERLARAMARALGPGHEVVFAEHGERALALLDAGTTFDVVLCDLMMPVMTGMDLYDALVARHPAVAERVVFMTGGAFTEEAHRFLDRVRNPRLEKPFSSDALRALLQRRGR